MADEQNEEIEVLRSIYAEKFEEIHLESSPKEYQVTLYPYAAESDSEQNFVGVTIKFSLPAEYPAVIPDISVYSVKGLTNKDCEELKQALDDMASSLVGSVAAFAILTNAQDWILQHNDAKAAAIIPQDDEESDIDSDDEENKISRFTTDKEASLNKLHSSTPVTLENFTEWKVKFDEEVKILRAQKLIAEPAKRFLGEISGKSYFEKKMGGKLLEFMANAAIKKQLLDEDGELVEDEQLLMEEFGEDDSVDIDDSLFLDE